MKTFRERIDALIKEYHLSRAEFERLCGLSNGYTRNLGTTPGVDKLEKILRQFPNVNRFWLLTGEGDMIYPNINQKNSNGPNVIGDNNFSESTNKELLDIIKKKDEQIDRLITLLERNTKNL